MFTKNRIKRIPDINVYKEQNQKISWYKCLQRTELKEFLQLQNAGFVHINK